MTKNEITRAALDNRISKAQNEVPLAVRQMLDDAANGKDFMIKLGSGLDSKFWSDGNVKIETPLGEFILHNNAINQLAGKYGISSREVKKYVSGAFGKDKGWQNDCVAYLLNQHAQHAKQERFLMRCVGNEVRGVLSEYYRVYDNEILLTEFLKQASESGAVYAGGHYNGLNIWLEMIYPETIKIKTENNGTVDIAFGARIKNSEFGASAFELRSFFMNAICANGLTRESLISQRHIGEKLPEGIEFSRELIQVNTRRDKLMVRDMTKSLFSTEYVRKSLITIQDASSIKIDIQAEINRLKELGLYKDELEETQIVLMNNRAEDGMQGENTLWKLTQAVSAVSRTRSEERRRELQEISASILPKAKEPILFVN